MGQWDRRRFISTRRSPPGAGSPDGTASASRGLLAQAPARRRAGRDSQSRRGQRCDAEPVMGQLPGQKRMYVLPDNAGEYHRVGGQVMKRIARRGRHRRRPRARHVHRQHRRDDAAARASEQPCRACSSCAARSSSSSAGDRWTMMRGDFANLPPGTPHAWTMRSDGAQLALFSMNHRVGAAFTAMGERQDGPQVPARRAARDPGSGARARAAAAGDFQLAPGRRVRGGAGPRDEQAAAADARRLRPRRRRRRAVRRQHLPRAEREHDRSVPVHHHRGRARRRRRRALSRAPFRELLRRSTARRSGGRTARPCRCARATISRRRRATCTASA